MAASPGGGGLTGTRAVWRTGSCVTVVAASEGYPGSYATGVPIEIPDELAAESAFGATGVVVFHAGTRREDGRVVTAGGRVLGVTAVGDDLPAARDRAYGALGRIGGKGLRWRTDIGWRDLAREESTA